jgi:hypothetical protein
LRQRGCPVGGHVEEGTGRGLGMAVRRHANTDRAGGWLLTTAGMGSVKQGSGVGTAVADVCAWPLCQVLKFTKLVQIQSSEFEFKFKLIQTLTGPNRTFLSLKISNKIWL